MPTPLEILLGVPAGARAANSFMQPPLLPEPPMPEDFALTEPPVEEPTILGQAADTALGGLMTAAHVLDTPGRGVRRLVAGQNPFGDNEVSGRDILEMYGLAPENKPGIFNDPADFAGDVGGFLTEVALDPFTYAGPGALTKLGKSIAMGGSKVRAAARSAKEALRVSKSAADDLARHVAAGTADDAMKAAAKNAADDVAKAAKVSELAEKEAKTAGQMAENFGDRIRQGQANLISIGLPFGPDEWQNAINIGAKQEWAATLADYLGMPYDMVAKSAVGRQLSAIFDPNVRDATEWVAQQAAKGSKAIEEELRQAGMQTAGAMDREMNQLEQSLKGPGAAGGAAPAAGTPVPTPTPTPPAAGVPASASAAKSAKDLRDSVQQMTPEGFEAWSSKLTRQDAEAAGFQSVEEMRARLREAMKAAPDVAGSVASAAEDAGLGPSPAPLYSKAAEQLPYPYNLPTAMLDDGVTMRVRDDVAQEGAELVERFVDDTAEGLADWANLRRGGEAAFKEFQDKYGISPYDAWEAVTGDRWQFPRWNDELQDAISKFPVDSMRGGGHNIAWTGDDDRVLYGLIKKLEDSGFAHVSHEAWPSADGVIHFNSYERGPLRFSSTELEGAGRLGEDRGRFLATLRSSGVDESGMKFLSDSMISQADSGLQNAGPAPLYAKSPGKKAAQPVAQQAAGALEYGDAPEDFIAKLSKKYSPQEVSDYLSVTDAFAAGVAADRGISKAEAWKLIVSKVSVSATEDLYTLVLDSGEHVKLTRGTKGDGYYYSVKVPNERAAKKVPVAATKKDLDKLIGEGKVFKAAGLTEGVARDVIRLYKSADARTWLHETMHAVTPLMRPDHMATVAEWAGKKLGVVLDKTNPANWSVEAHEALADAFEDYLATGKAPTPKLLPIFERIAASFRTIFESLKRKLGFAGGSPELHQVFDEMLTPRSAVRKVELASPAGAVAERLIPAAGVAASKAEQSARAAPVAKASPDVVDAIRRVDTAAGDIRGAGATGEPIGVRALRESLGLPREEADAAILDAIKSGKITAHEYSDQGISLADAVVDPVTDARYAEFEVATQAAAPAAKAAPVAAKRTASAGEAALVRAAQSGDEAATNALMQAVTEKLNLIARGMQAPAGVDMDSLVQDTVLSVLKDLPKIDPDQPLGGLLNYKLSNAVKSELASLVREDLVHTPTGQAISKSGNTYWITDPATGERRVVAASKADLTKLKESQEVRSTKFAHVSNRTSMSGAGDAADLIENATESGSLAARGGAGDAAPEAALETLAAGVAGAKGHVPLKDLYKQVGEWRELLGAATGAVSVATHGRMNKSLESLLQKMDAYKAADASYQELLAKGEAIGGAQKTARAAELKKAFALREETGKAVQKQYAKTRKVVQGGTKDVLAKKFQEMGKKLDVAKPAKLGNLRDRIKKIGPAAPSEPPVVFAKPVEPVVSAGPAKPVEPVVAKAGQPKPVEPKAGPIAKPPVKPAEPVVTAPPVNPAEPVAAAPAKPGLMKPFGKAEVAAYVGARLADPAISKWVDDAAKVDGWTRKEMVDWLEASSQEFARTRGRLPNDFSELINSLDASEVESFLATKPGSLASSVVAPAAAAPAAKLPASFAKLPSSAKAIVKEAAEVSDEILAKFDEAVKANTELVNEVISSVDKKLISTAWAPNNPYSGVGDMPQEVADARWRAAAGRWYKKTNKVAMRDIERDVPKEIARLQSRLAQVDPRGKKARQIKKQLEELAGQPKGAAPQPGLPAPKPAEPVPAAGPMGPRADVPLQEQIARAQAAKKAMPEEAAAGAVTQPPTAPPAGAATPPSSAAQPPAGQPPVGSGELPGVPPPGAIPSTLERVVRKMVEDVSLDANDVELIKHNPEGVRDFANRLRAKADEFLEIGQNLGIVAKLEDVVKYFLRESSELPLAPAEQARRDWLTYIKTIVLGGGKHKGHKALQVSDWSNVSRDKALTGWVGGTVAINDFVRKWAGGSAEAMKGDLTQVLAHIPDAKDNAAKINAVAEYISKLPKEYRDPKSPDFFDLSIVDNLWANQQRMARKIGGASAIHKLFADTGDVGLSGKVFSIEKAMKEAGLAGEEDRVLKFFLQENAETLASKGIKTLDELKEKFGVPEEMVRQAQRFIRPIQDPENLKIFLGFWDKATNLTKAALTVLWPANWARNLFSGQYANWVGGAFSVDGFKGAWDIASGRGNKYLKEMEELAVLDPLSGYRGFGDRAVKNIRKVADVDKIITPSGMYAKNLEHTNLPGLLGKWEAAGHTAAGLVEVLNRATSYISLRKAGWEPYEAAMKTKSLQFDYSSLSAAEKQIVKRLVPFWVYTKQNAIWHIKELMQHPGGPVAQSIRAAKVAREDSDVPPWMGGFVTPLGESEDKSTQRYLSGLGLPFEEAFERIGPTVGRTAENHLAMLNPMVKGPLEALAGRQFFTGRDLSDLYPYPTGNQAVDQALYNSPASRAITTARTVSDDRKGVGAKALNLLTGIRISDVDVEQAKRAAQREAVRLALEQSPNIKQRKILTKKKDAELTPEEEALLKAYRSKG